MCPIYHVAWMHSKLYQVVRKARGKFGNSNECFVEIFATIVFFVVDKTLPTVIIVGVTTACWNI